MPIIRNWFIALLCLSGVVLAEDLIKVGRFSEGSLEGWKPKRFVGQTHYRLIEVRGVTVLEAKSDQSASGMFRKVEIDLERTPILNWCWQLIEPLPPLPETTKAGDDYAARIYLVKKGGLAFWRTKALNYVWSSTQPKESLWPNAFAGDNVMMLAVRNFEDKPGQWLCEKRDLRSDWQRAFGERTKILDAIAVMTDSDNSKHQTGAYYGDIWFSQN